MPVEYQDLWAQCELRNRQLEEKSRQIEALLDSSPAGILVISQDRHVLRANSHARRMLAAGETLLDGTWTADLIADLSARLGPIEAVRVLAAALGGQPTQTEVSLSTPEPRTLWIQQTDVRDSAGASLGALFSLLARTSSGLLGRQLQQPPGW